MNTNNHLACGKCNEYLLIVSPEKDFTKEIQDNGGDIDGVLIFECPGKEDSDDGHTRIILDLAKIIETGKVLKESPGVNEGWPDYGRDIR